MIMVILWPFAYKYAELLHNHLSMDKKGYSPVQKFGDTTHHLNMKDFHTWGCPCYVLDKALQTGSMNPKWDWRVRLGIYLGHSPCHAGSVALVLNPKMLHISPQFHVVFEYNFSTVPYLSNSDIPPSWKELVRKTESSSADIYDISQQWIKTQLKFDTQVHDQEGDKIASEATHEQNQKVIQTSEGEKKYSGPHATHMT